MGKIIFKEGETQMKSKLWKVLAVVFAAMMLFVFAACTPDDPNPNPNPNPNPEEQQKPGPGDDETPTVTKLEITHAPNKVEYLAGETFDPAGMKLKATWSHGEEEDLSPQECEYNKDPLTAGTTEVVFTYETKTASQPITVTDVAVTGIEIDRRQVGTLQYTADPIDLTKIAVTLKYGDGSERVTDSFTLSEGGKVLENPYAYSVTAGNHTITVEAAGKTGTFDVFGVIGAKVQAENTNAVQFYDNTNTLVQTGTFPSTVENITPMSGDPGTMYSGADGYHVGGFDKDQWNGATVRITFSAPQAGEYRVVLRGQYNNGDHGSFNNIYETCANPEGDDPAQWTFTQQDNTILDCSRVGSWTEMLSWTIITVGNVQLKAGDNLVVVRIKNMRSANLDWFAIEKADQTLPEFKPEVFSMRYAGFTFMQNEVSDCAGSGSVTARPTEGVDEEPSAVDRSGVQFYSGLYVRVKLTDKNCDYYDYFIGDEALTKNEKFDLSTVGTHTITLTLDILGQSFTFDFTYTVVEE